MARRWHSKGTPGGVRSKAVSVAVSATTSDLERMRKHVDRIAIEKALPTDVKQSLYNDFMKAEDKA
jgi:hypothetical protein